MLASKKTLPPFTNRDAPDKSFCSSFEKSSSMLFSFRPVSTSGSVTIYYVLIAFERYFMSLKSNETITLSVSITLNSVSGLTET
jgi:hypothetical protein